MKNNNKIKRFLKVAEAVSETSKFPQIQIGAIIVDKNTVISCGVNQRKSHPVQMRYNMLSHVVCSKNHEKYVRHHPHFLHAEIDAITKAKHLDLNGSSIFIFRKNANDDIAMCRPCEACMQAIIDAKIENIFYTTEAGIIHEQVRRVH